MISKKKPKIGRWIVVLLWLVVVGYFLLFRSFALHQEVVVHQGDSFAVFYQPLSSLQRLQLKRHISRHSVDTTQIGIGTYVFSGSYMPSSYIQTILAWPAQTYQRITILEGRSIYDIDDMLAKKGLIKKGDYISYTLNFKSLRPSATSLSQGRLTGSSYDFLQEAGGVSSLEWFLYPDTYFIGMDSDVVSALVYAQLDAFDIKVWQKVRDQIPQFTTTLSRDFPGVSLSLHTIIILASVVEKEERSVANKPTIAGIFLRRLSQGMRLDADISLCYGLKQPYSVCTPNFISRWIDDATNLYNTRKHLWLPPQAIANPSFDAINAVLHYTKSDYLYYLHDSEGNIHYATSLDQHNSNKQQYLQ